MRGTLPHPPVTGKHLQQRDVFLGGRGLLLLPFRLALAALFKGVPPLPAASHAVAVGRRFRGGFKEGAPTSKRAVRGRGVLALGVLPVFAPPRLSLREPEEGGVRLSVRPSALRLRIGRG